MKNKAATLLFAGGQAGWTIVGLIGSSLLVYGLLGALPLEVKNYFSTDSFGMVIVSASIYLLAIAIIFLPILWRPERYEISKLVGIAKRLTFSAIGLAIIGFVAYFLLSTAISLLVANVPGFNAEQSQDVGFNNLSTTYEYIAAFVGLVILPPIAEELIFRGYLFGRLRQRFGFVVSALIPSVVFASLHLQWNVGVDVFVLSLVLCYLREKTGSIWAGMIVHGLKNGVAYFVLFIMPLLHSDLLQ